MPRDIGINRSIVISDSKLDNTSIVNKNEDAGSTAISPEMWNTMLELAREHGKHREEQMVLQLKAKLDQGKRSEARHLWDRVKSFLQVVANVAQIVGTVEAVLR